MEIKQIEVTLLGVVLDITGLVVNQLGWIYITLVPLGFIIYALVTREYYFAVAAIVTAIIGAILRWFSNGIIKRKKIRTILSGIFLIFISCASTYTLFSQPESSSNIIPSLSMTIPMFIFGLLLVLGVIKNAD